ncbi:MAG: OadG family protein [Acutalibacteraceae bacterium]
MELALNLFLAGFVIVFAVLVVLIFIVKIYSTIVQSVTGAAKKKKEKKEAAKVTVQNVTETPTLTETDTAEDEDGISGEVVAAIAAAVDYIYGEKPHKIKSVKRTKSARSAWAAAGLRENTRPF